MGMPPFNKYDKIFDPPGTGSTGYLPFPLVVVIIGGHEPQWVEDVLARVRELSVPNKVFPDSALMMVTGYVIIIARQEMVRN